MTAHKWKNAGEFSPRSYTCGYCYRVVGPNMGYYYEGDPEHQKIYICSFCKKPTYFAFDVQYPGVSYGAEVLHLPDDIGALYQEARDCMAVSSHTSAVLTCRKLLMNIAVSKGDKPGKSFISYVEYLDSEGYVPTGGEGWVDHIREKGNEANHEIALMSRSDAEELISFIEMLLKIIYEFPSRISTPEEPTSPS